MATLARLGSPQARAPTCRAHFHKLASRRRGDQCAAQTVRLCGSAVTPPRRSGGGKFDQSEGARTPATTRTTTDEENTARRRLGPSSEKLSADCGAYLFFSSECSARNQRRPLVERLDGPTGRPRPRSSPRHRDEIREGSRLWRLKTTALRRPFALRSHQRCLAWRLVLSIGAPSIHTAIGRSGPEGRNEPRSHEVARRRRMSPPPSPNGPSMKAPFSSAPRFAAARFLSTSPRWRVGDVDAEHLDSCCTSGCAYRCDTPVVFLI